MGASVCCECNLHDRTGRLENKKSKSVMKTLLHDRIGRLENLMDKPKLIQQ
ncbi:hypothetical protein AO385_0021 [Moraxella catarrhalis]|nr:hypothetical protein AO385_0021 [Moraxella catarrhalis]